MPRLELDINPDSLAERGYTAFWQTNEASLRGHILPQWENAPVDVRNFWRKWARVFIQNAMMGG